MTEIPIAPRPTAPKFAEIRAGFTSSQEKAFKKLSTEQKKELRKQGLMWGLVAADAAPGGTQSLLQVFLEAAEKGLLDGTPAANAALQRLIRQSAWGQQYTATQEEFLLGKYQFPEEYDKSMNGTSITIGGKTQRTPGWIEWVKNTALANGATITDEEAIEVAEYILMNKLNDTQAERIVLGYVDFEQADLLGKAGIAQDSIDRYARQYGIKLSPQETSKLIQDNVFGRNTLNDIVDTFRRNAASKYSNFSDRIMAGETVEGIARPYRDMATELLELADIGMEDNLILDALSSKKYESLTDFKRAIKSDPRWQRTDNAREEYSGIGRRILKDFGFIG